jgi:sigma-E factor negative regulatory protein RseC
LIEERASVVAIDGQSVWVETQRASACGKCAANKGCGNAVLQKVVGNKRNVVRVVSDVPVRVGDDVVIGISEDAIVKGSLMVYALPILLVIVFAILGETYAANSLSIDKDILSIVGGLFGLFVSIVVLRWF